MAWYTPIYIYVRLLRERRPVLGWLLSLCLNVTFIVQWAIGIYTTYVYIFIFCGCVVVYRAQALVYIYVHLSLLAISLVCLGRAFFRRVARVPDKYKVEEATATALEEATPREGERFHVDKSSEEQTRKQKTLLEEVIREKKLGLIETDTQGRFRYCYVCRQLKPDRAHHCSSCGFCVLKFDHHCPWINKCVGYHNYKFFVLYIFYTLSYITWFVVTTFEGFVRFFLSDNYEENLPWFVHLVASYALLCFFGYYPIADLFVYHADLIANNETTCEIVKRPLIRGDSKADYNLSTYRNVQLVFGWGLWLFPVDTAISDGEHFEARYVERENEARVRLAEEGDEDAE